ncbi:MAG: hypothetical protein ACXQTN_06645 [Methanoculleaceae archaeon]
MNTITEILELDGCRLVEETYADLIYQDYTDYLLSLPASEARLLVDENDDPLALAIRTGESWLAVTFLHRPPVRGVIRIFAMVGGDIYQEERSVWARAVRRYYSERLCEEVTPAHEDLAPDRIEKVRDLLSGVFGKGAGGVCIDACSGSGVGSAAIRDLGMVPFAYDNDPALLVRGITAGRICPDEGICIDGCMAEAYIEPAPRGIMLMAGQIYPFNAEEWKSLVLPLIHLAADCLFTTGSENEIQQIAEWCSAEGRETEVWEEERDPIYDRWCCRAE